jgi:hypothetical protein
MYQRVAQYSLSQAVISRIDSIIGVTPGYEFDNFNRTNWNDAYGAIINCDFFPVRIAQMPTGYTPESLVEYFRKNTNLFIDSSIGVTFGFYNHGGFNDSVRYNANDTNSTGAVIHIGMENDGSVIQSSYFHDYMSGHERHRFTFSTMRTPLDYAHPVAGNRDFGIYRSTDAAHPNDFCFYTMGVDRVTDWVFASGDILLQELTGLSGFIKADLLWHNVQKNMISFIEGHGGHAGFYATPFIRARPKYADVRDYLSGTISWEILKEKLGC